ncbi:uncharacterized protein LOC132940028 [Metopolophium dirhodum]|uniref:uncharacterized protein LOC132940028 n=1 Tax=Metopolophium dirhodum TaxID=44670 RepID=UPI00298F9885|nr:uncharacterized protein LOC132940028 [Metopolophium dirhodum]
MSVSLNVREMCRICLCEEEIVDILMLGEPTAKWMSDINKYFNVQLTFHDDKSTNLCRSCMHKIENWRKDLHRAASCQTIIDYLDRMHVVCTSKVEEGGIERYDVEVYVDNHCCGIPLKPIMVVVGDSRNNYEIEDSLLPRGGGRRCGRPKENGL